MKKRLKNYLRNEAADSAYRKIRMAGSDPKDYSQAELEVLIREEEDKHLFKYGLKAVGVVGTIFGFGIGVNF